MPKSKIPRSRIPESRIPKSRVRKSGAPAAVDLGELPRLVGYALRRAQLAVFQDFFRSFAQVRIRPAQFSVLAILERNPGLKQTDVAAVPGIKRTNFVVLLDELEHRGLAQRRAAQGDRRSSALHLTDKGRTLLRKLKRLVAAHERRVTARIGPSNRNQLIRILQHLADGRG